jgi:hypothetical protein
MLSNRISIFVSLPIGSLDRLALKKQLDRVGQAKDAGGSRAYCDIFEGVSLSSAKTCSHTPNWFGQSVVSSSSVRHSEAQRLLFGRVLDEVGGLARSDPAPIADAIGPQSKSFARSSKSLAPTDKSCNVGACDKSGDSAVPRFGALGKLSSAQPVIVGAAVYAYGET